jgi:hypothetical protein
MNISKHFSMTAAERAAVLSNLQEQIGEDAVESAINTALFDILNHIPPHFIKIKNPSQQSRAADRANLKYFMYANKIYRAALTSHYVAFESPEEAMLFKLTMH